MPEVRRRNAGDSWGARAGRALSGVTGGGGMAPAINRILANLTSTGNITTHGTADYREIDESQPVTSYGPKSLLDGVAPGGWWSITGYVTAVASEAMGGLTIQCGNTDPDVVSNQWSGTVSGEQRLYLPPFNFLAARQPAIEAGWDGAPIDLLELHIRAVKF